MKIVKFKFAIASIFLWIGFVCAISFMEAWLKFQAPGVTLPIGLGIGRLVFSALNKVEWFLAIVILGNLYFSKVKLSKITHLLYILPVVLLLIQTFWALPALDDRATLYIKQAVVPSSNLHYYYVGMEILKIVCLFIFGNKLLNNTKYTTHDYSK